MASDPTQLEPTADGELAGDGDPQPVETAPLEPTARTFRSLSVVIPAFNEAESLPELYQELVAELPKSGVAFEVIFVDDGSTDTTRQVAVDICGRDDRFRYVRLRRNFGKAAALSEGFRRARGDVVVTMDADLQDNPAEVERLLKLIDEGYDLVSGWKWPRLDPVGKRLPSKLYNWTVRRFTGLTLHDMNCGLKAYRREMTDTVSLYGDMHRYVPVKAQAQGFRVGETKVSHRPRRFGRSKYSVGRFSRGLLDLLTVLFLTRYRTRPLHLIGGLGLLMGLSGMIVLLYLSILWFAGQPIGGRPLFFLGILLLIVAVQLITFGLLAEMVASFFLEHENDYPVTEEVGFGTEEVPRADS
jgi:glycosyltransferase involved in cell wall biosynthesis